MSQMIDKNQIIKKRPDGTLDVGTYNDGKPDKGCKPTQQEFADECDINKIMKRYETTGEFTHLTSKQGVYADFSEIRDYQGMLETVARAQEAFQSLPAPVRLRFKNDPGELLTYIQDPNNKAEAIQLGLIQKAEPTTQQNLNQQQQQPTQTPPTPQENQKN